MSISVPTCDSSYLHCRVLHVEPLPSLRGSLWTDTQAGHVYETGVEPQLLLEDRDQERDLGANHASVGGGVDEDQIGSTFLPVHENNVHVILK